MQKYFPGFVVFAILEYGSQYCVQMIIVLKLAVQNLANMKSLR